MFGNARYDVEQRVNTSFFSHLDQFVFFFSYDEETTNKKVQVFRKMLIEREGLYEKTETDYDEHGRPA